MTVFFRQQLTNLLYNIYATVVVFYKYMWTDEITKVRYDTDMAACTCEYDYCQLSDWVALITRP